MIAKDPALLNSPQIHQQNKVVMDSIRDVIEAMLMGEEARRKDLSARAPDLEHNEFISIVAAALFVGVAVALFTRQRLRTVSNSYTAALKEVERRSREVHELF